MDHSQIDQIRLKKLTKTFCIVSCALLLATLVLFISNRTSPIRYGELEAVAIRTKAHDACSSAGQELEMFADPAFLNSKGIIIPGDSASGRDILIATTSKPEMISNVAAGKVLSSNGVDQVVCWDARTGKPSAQFSFGWARQVESMIVLRSSYALVVVDPVLASNAAKRLVVLDLMRRKIASAMPFTPGGSVLSLSENSAGEVLLTGKPSGRVAVLKSLANELEEAEIPDRITAASWAERSVLIGTEAGDVFMKEANSSVTHKLTSLGSRIDRLVDYGDGIRVIAFCQSPRKGPFFSQRPVILNKLTGVTEFQGPWSDSNSKWISTEGGRHLFVNASGSCGLISRDNGRRWILSRGKLPTEGLLFVRLTGRYLSAFYVDKRIDYMLRISRSDDG